MTLESSVDEGDSPWAGTHDGLAGSEGRRVVSRPRNRLASLAGCVIAAGLGVLAHVVQVHHLNLWPLAAALFVVQVVLALAWVAALEAKGSGGAVLIGVAAAGVADGLLAARPGKGLTVFAAIFGLALVGGLIHQMIRRPRPEVIGSLAATASLVLIELAAASMLALPNLIPDSGDVVAAGLFGLAAAMAVGRLVDTVLPRPPLAPHASRGAFGAIAGVAAAAAVGSLWAQGRTLLGGDGVGIRIALVASLLAIVADLAVDVAGDSPDLDERVRAALTPLTMLLPIAFAGPAIYVAGRYLLG